MGLGRAAGVGGVGARAADEGRAELLHDLLFHEAAAGPGRGWSSPWEGCEAGLRGGGPMLAGGWTETGGMFGVSLMGMDLGTGVGILVTEQLAVSDGETVADADGPGPWLWPAAATGEGAFL